MKRNVHGSSSTAAAADLTSASELDDNEIVLRVMWSGSMYPVELPSDATVSDLKGIMWELTEVLPKRQKLIGIPRAKGGPLVTDETILSTLPLKPDQKIMLIGTREADINAVAAKSAAAESSANSVVNDLDLDVDYSCDSTESTICYQESNKKKLQRRLDSTSITIINEPRAGKKLLVLDLDLTLFDTKGMQRTPMSQLARPGLHRFLACCYANYDLVIWSQTSWRWLEAKLTELDMLMHPDYKISFVLDRTSMFSITSERGRVERRHEVKALEIIWRKFPEGKFGPVNTIHIDDLSRNFALNPQSGLKISPYKHSQTTNVASTDRELYYLMRYLSLIAREESGFTTLNHKHWKQYAAARANVTLGDDSDRVLQDLSGLGSAPPDSG